MKEIPKPEHILYRRILVVDDELVNREILGMIVGKEYDVLYAENGIDALEKIHENETSLSLILLDLNMPKMDGFELLKVLSRDEELRRIPVIVLTAEHSAEVKALSLGAVDFLSKPYDAPEIIMARIKRSILLAEDNVIIHETETDSQTGLYTLGFFLHYAKQHDKFCPDMKMDAIRLNINRFHLINELYGRAYGDKVLDIISDILKDIVVRVEGLACRCESDKFQLYIPHRDDYDTIIAEYSEKHLAELEKKQIFVRIGIYDDVDMSIPIEQRFDRAALACNMQKDTHHTAFRMYDKQMHEKELFNERLTLELDRAIAEKQFCVYYQPKYDITGDVPRLRSAEALVRWIHPELGMISPGVFIPTFEESGLISKVDRFVWEETAAQISAWKKKFGISIPVSVNVSRIDANDYNLYTILLDITKRNGLAENELLLEITESAYTENEDQILDTVKKLHSSGFCIEMDDFGSGYSSLNMLAAMPIDALKLDMQFVRNICESEKDYRLTQLIIDAANYLKIPVIAEGVETEEQMLLLKRAGCSIIQGYYFSKPVPAVDFEKFIKAEE